MEEAHTSNARALGRIVILNGAPRSGKSSIVRVIQATFDGIWMNLGVDTVMAMTPKHLLPGIGLRPGGEGPQLELAIVAMYRAMYESIAAHSRCGIHVVVDVGHHDMYSTSLGILPMCARVLTGLPVLFVGIRCPIEVVMERRIATWNAGYEEDGTVPAPVLRWQTAVHEPGIYDLELDTSVLTPEDCARQIRRQLEASQAPTAFRRLAEMGQD